MVMMAMRMAWQLTILRLTRSCAGDLMASLPDLLAGGLMLPLEEHMLRGKDRSVLTHLQIPYVLGGAPLPPAQLLPPVRSRACRCNRVWEGRASCHPYRILLEPWPSTQLLPRPPTAPVHTLMRMRVR